MADYLQLWTQANIKTMRTFSPITTRSLFNDFFFDQTVRHQTNHQLFSTEKGWALRIDLPGFSKQELQLKYEDKALSLKAQSSEDAETARPVVSQRYALGEEVDTKQITAKLEHGVLEVQLPRLEEQPEQTSSINIQ